MEVYLIRHAQSQNNATEIFNAKDRVSDPALTELGHRQAEALARFWNEGFNPERIIEAQMKRTPDTQNLNGYLLDELYCSPMHRSLQTASYIARATGLKPTVWKDIHEHGGLFLEHEDERGLVGYPGKTRTEIVTEFPDFQVTDDITEEGWWTGVAEDISEAQGRAIKVAMELRQKAADEPDKRIGLVSHGTFIGQLLKALGNNLPSRQLWFWHFNTAFDRVDLHTSEQISIRYTNRILHLTPELIS